MNDRQRDYFRAELLAWKDEILREARDTLQKLAAVVFDEERRGAEELIEGKDVVRESFFIPIPRAA